MTDRGRPRRHGQHEKMNIQNPAPNLMPDLLGGLPSARQIGHQEKSFSDPALDSPSQQAGQTTQQGERQGNFPFFPGPHHGGQLSNLQFHPA